MNNTVFSPTIVYNVDDTILMENGDLAFCLEDRKIYFKINDDVQYYGGGDIDIEEITNIVNNILEEYKEDILLLLEQKFEEFLDSVELNTYIEQKFEEFITKVKEEFNQKFEALSVKWEIIDNILVYIGEAAIAIIFDAPNEFDFTEVVPETVKVPFYTNVGRNVRIGQFDKVTNELHEYENVEPQSLDITSRLNNSLSKDELTITVKHIDSNNEEIGELEYTVDNYANFMYDPSSELTNKPSNIIIPATNLNRYGGKITVTIAAKINVLTPAEGDAPHVLIEQNDTQSITINIKKK